MALSLKEIRDEIDARCVEAGAQLRSAGDPAEIREAMVAAIESFRELQEKVEHELAMSEPPAPTVLIQFSRDATLYSIPSDPERRGWLSVETFPLPVPPADERRPGIIPVIFPGLKRSYWRAMIPHRSGLGLTYIALGRTSERGLDDDLVLDFRTAAVYQEPARKSKKRGR